MSTYATTKTLVISGASSGIGALHADRLTSKGDGLLFLARCVNKFVALVTKLSAKDGMSLNTTKANLATKAGRASVEELLTDGPNVAQNRTGRTTSSPLECTSKPCSKIGN